MNRATRKRASKLRSKALKSLAKLGGSDLQSVSRRLTEEQYVEVLGLFESPGERSVAEFARAIAEGVMVATARTSTQEIPKLATPSDLQAINCRAGCAWCCHRPMQVSIVSAISVAAFILDRDERDTWLPKLQAYVDSLSSCGNERDALKACFLPCPFLDGAARCRVYEARPVVCQAFHSTRVEACRAKVEEASVTRDVPMYPNLFGFLGMSLSGARRALTDMGVDDRPVVLATAVKLLLEDFSGTVERWLAGDPVFDEAAVKR